jgi:hypothetical protein
MAKAGTAMLIATAVDNAAAANVRSFIRKMGKSK